MAVRIRLARHGTKKKPIYRVVVTDSNSPRDGRFIEVIGSYDPNVNPQAVEFKAERVFHWLDNGAVPSETVRHLIKKAGLKREQAA